MNFLQFWDGVPSNGQIFLPAGENYVLKLFACVYNHGLTLAPEAAGSGPAGMCLRWRLAAAYPPSLRSRPGPARGQGRGGPSK